MKTFKMLKQTSLALLFSYAAASSASTIYKWVDEKGQPHFGQNPPEQFQAEQISPKTRSFGQHIEHHPEAAQDTTLAEETVPDVNNEPEQAQAEEVAEEVFKKDPALCSQAQENKRLLMQHPIIRRQGKVLTVDEKNKELRDTEEIIKVHC